MTNNEWIDATDDGLCPVCGEKIKQCAGIELFPATRLDPADYGCLGEEEKAGLNTTILAHGECAVGAENTDTELCAACDEAMRREEDYWDSYEPDEADAPDLDDYYAPGGGY